MSEITREYIAGILCAMQIAGDDEASEAIEKFIVQLEAELEVWKRPIVCHWCEEGVTEDEAVEHYKSCTKNPLRAENEALKERDKKVTEHLRTFVSGLVTVEQMYLLADALLTKDE